MSGQRPDARPAQQDLRLARKGAGTGGGQGRPRRRSGRDRRPARLVRLRQDQHAADDRRFRECERGGDPGRRPAGPGPAAQGPRRRDGVRRLCALPAADDPGQHRLRPAAGAARRATRSPNGSARSPGCSRSATSSTATLRPSRPASSSGPALLAPWSAAPRSPCSTSPCRSWSRSCARSYGRGSRTI